MTCSEFERALSPLPPRAISTAYRRSIGLSPCGYARTQKLIPARSGALTLVRMKQSNAGGRTTQTTLGLMALHLDRQLGRLSEALDEALDKAGRIPRAQDEYGHHRAGEIGHAMQIAKASAKLISSLAKIDREFRHNILVSRDDMPAREPRMIRGEPADPNPVPHMEAMLGDPPRKS